MPGASDETRRVDVVNANWTAGEDGADGTFQLLLVTEDGERHTIAPSPAAMTAARGADPGRHGAALGSREPDLDRGECCGRLAADGLVGRTPRNLRHRQRGRG